MSRVFQLWIVSLLVLAAIPGGARGNANPCALCVTSLTPSSIDLIAPPATFTIAGGGFVDSGFGPPVVNFTRAGELLGQARALVLAASATLTVPFPTPVTSLGGQLPQLSAGDPVLVQVFNQTGPTSYLLVGSTPLTVQDSRPPAQVTSVTPDSFDLANPLPTTFTIAGQRFADTGFGLPVVNFTRAGVLVGQARAKSLIGSTTLTSPFPTETTSVSGREAGPSTAGAVLVQVYNQTGPSNYVLVGGTTLTITDARLCALCVRSLTPSSIDLIAVPATFTVFGGGFVDKGFGPPVVNFTRAGVMLGQARANSLIGKTTLIVPFPTEVTSLKGPLPGLSVGGPVRVQVYNQTGPISYFLVGSTQLTIQDSGPPAHIASITPDSFDLANALPTMFTIAGERLADSGFGAPLVNLTRGGVLLGQARANSLNGSTTLTVPFPTNATSLKGPLPGVLGGGPVLVEVYNQTGPSSYRLVGGITLTVTDSRPLQVTRITPSSIDLTTDPATFTIDGQRFADNGFGRPVVNFMRNGVLLGQARATALGGNTSLTVPFPTNATSLNGPLPGLSFGAVLVQVYNQTGPSSYVLIGGITLDVSDSRPCTPPCVSSLTPSSIDLIDPPPTFSIAGGGFADSGSGSPIVSFIRNGVVLGQARATAMTGSTSLTVPFPTNGTSLIGPLPGLSADAAPVNVQVYNQTGPSSYPFVGSTTFTVADSRPPAQVNSITPNSIDLVAPPATFTIAGQRFADAGFGRPVANFTRNGVLLGQARATALGDSTTLTVPFPTNATSLSGPWPGLSAGDPVLVQVYNQTGPSSHLLIGSITLTVTNSR